MNQADVTRLVSKLRFNIRIRHRKLKTIKGPEYRLQRMANIVTGLFKYERLELNSHVADEARGYAERVNNRQHFVGNCRKFIEKK